MPTLSAPDAKRKVCDRPDIQQFLPVFSPECLLTFSLYNVVNIVKVAADVRSGCKTFPCSPCDTGVMLVRSAFS